MKHSTTRLSKQSSNQAIKQSTKQFDEIEVVNRQRKYAIDENMWRKFGARAYAAVKKIAVGKNGLVTIAFVSKSLIRQLNRDFRKQDKVTDVLSFTASQDDFELIETLVLGDIVICAERAAQQAKENDLSFDEEIAQLILHGLLHLAGFDHATDNGEMNRLELDLRRRLAI